MQGISRLSKKNSEYCLYYQLMGGSYVKSRATEEISHTPHICHPF